MSLYTEMYKRGKDRILIKTSDVSHHLSLGYTLETKLEEEAPKKKTYVAKNKEEKAENSSGGN